MKEENGLKIRRGDFAKLHTNAAESQQHAYTLDQAARAQPVPVLETFYAKPELCPTCLQAQKTSSRVT
jgi:hypothetical protein